MYCLSICDIHLRSVKKTLFECWDGELPKSKVYVLKSGDPCAHNREDWLLYPLHVHFGGNSHGCVALMATMKGLTISSHLHWTSFLWSPSTRRETRWGSQASLSHAHGMPPAYQCEGQQHREKIQLHRQFQRSFSCSRCSALCLVSDVASGWRQGAGWRTCPGQENPTWWRCSVSGCCWWWHRTREEGWSLRERERMGTWEQEQLGQWGFLTCCLCGEEIKTQNNHDSS